MMILKSPREQAAEARALWLAAKSPEDLKKVRQLYIQALTTTTSTTSTTITDTKKKKKRKRNVIQNDNNQQLTKQERDAMITEKLILLLIQTGQSRKSFTLKLLEGLGCVCRLSDKVLNYENPPITSKTTILRKTQKDEPAAPSPCIILDRFLSKAEQRKLSQVFENPVANYWVHHKYQIEPPTPYFSYVIPIDDHSRYGFVGSLIHKIYTCDVLIQKFPGLKNAKYAEMWAHNRPHASGHQMHFDSDDEGNGGDIRNPIISTILYVSAGSGGPSLVTTQKLSDDKLAEKGFLSYPVDLRLVAFNGKVLHGVVPGKGISSNDEGRRVTLMFAFWKHIKIRNGETPGSARPFPNRRSSSSSNHNRMKNNELPLWATDLLDSSQSADMIVYNDGGNSGIIVADPVEISPVYETCDGRPWSQSMGMPPYDNLFQGF